MNDFLIKDLLTILQDAEDATLPDIAASTRTKAVNGFIKQYNNQLLMKLTSYIVRRDAQVFNDAYAKGQQKRG